MILAPGGGKCDQARIMGVFDRNYHRRTDVAEVFLASDAMLLATQIDLHADTTRDASRPCVADSKISSSGPCSSVRRRGLA